MKKYISIFVVLIIVATSGCKKTYLSELAASPNTPSATTPNLALAGALKTTAAIINGTGYNVFDAWMGYLSWSTSYQANTTWESYNITSSSFDLWSNVYLNISNYNAMQASTGEPYYQAIAKIMIAYDFENLVDQYNNVPYTQALQGVTTLTPTYDTGTSIYDALLKQLDAAMAQIQGANATSALNPGTSDVMYGGNMTKWVKFANTLKLRLAIRQSNLSAKFAALQTAVQATSANGYIDLTSEGNVQPGYTNSDANGGDQSPLDLNYGYTQSGSSQTYNKETQANTFAVNFFIGTGTPLAPEDPRLFGVYAPSPSAGAGGKVESTIFGATAAPREASGAVTPSKLSAYLLSPTKAAVIISAAESNFLQSEAYASGLLTGGYAAAANSYKLGVEASFIEDGLTAAQADTYLLNSNVAFPASGSPFATIQAAIITQKWAALNPYGGFEAYNEFRRTGASANGGVPAVPVSILPGVSTTIMPNRLPYPVIEQQTNANNLGAQGVIDIYQSKIFWAK